MHREKILYNFIFIIAQDMPPRKAKTVGTDSRETSERTKGKNACVGDVRYIGLFSAREPVKDKRIKEHKVPGYPLGTFFAFEGVKSQNKI